MKGTPFSLLVFSIAFAFGGSGSFACTAGRIIPLPISVKSDCSFNHAGEGSWGAGYGGAAVDVGGKRIAQKLNFGSSGCSIHESLLFVECASGQSIVFEGLGDPRIGGTGVSAYIRLIQPPNGPIALTASRTVTELRALAEASSIKIIGSGPDMAGELSPLNRFNPFCGCKLFYPNSMAADLGWNGI